MISVDLWDNKHKAGDEGYEKHDMEGYYQRFRAHVRECFPGRVSVIRDDTSSVAKFYKDGQFDFVFIDADHSLDGVRRDIEAWLPKIRKGGLICGHDFNWPEVKQAVTEKFERVIQASDKVWIVMI